MNIRLVSNLLGKLLVMFSASFLLPIAVSLLYGEDPKPFLAAMGLTLAGGVLLLIFSKTKSEFESIRQREGFAIVAIIWLLMSIFGAVPYLFYHVTAVDAFFESMSGFTTTGASVLTPESYPRSLLLWRGMTQWIGGMGIIVLFLAIFPNVARKSATLFQAEYPGVTLSKIKPRIRDTAISLYKVYLTLTVLEILLLCVFGVPLFDSVAHTFTTLSTGGYSTHSESIAYFSNPCVEAIVAIFAFLGGSNFALLYMLSRGKADILKNSEFRVYTAFIIIFSLMLAAINLERYDLLDSLRYSIFQAVSIMTTTGFTTADFDVWSDSAKMILLLLMFIGGSSGSTGGGIKVVRVYLLIKYAIQQILRAAEPRRVRTVKFEGKVVKKETLDDVAAFFILYIFIFAISSLIISICGYDIVTSVSATAATLGNVGPGMGLAGASENYASFPVHLKLLLVLNMWVGRLEIFTVASIFIPSFWKERW